MKLRRHLFLLLAALLIAAAGDRAAASVAAASAWAETEHGAVRLIAAVTGVGSAAQVPAAVEFRMKPGWHIYWRSPGDAGYPPQVDWSRSDNLGAAVLRWPAPHRFSVLDLQTIGYSDRVTLPVEVSLLRRASRFACAPPWTT